MKKIIMSLIIMGTLLLTGCFSSTEKDEKITDKNQDVISAILELANSNSTRTTAGEVTNATNGVYSGVYLSVSGVYYSYTFSDLASLDSNGKMNFITKWTSATESLSYIILGNSSLRLDNAKNAISSNTSLVLKLANTGESTVDNSFIIKPESLIIEYSDNFVNFKRADRTPNIVKIPLMAFVANGTSWNGLHVLSNYNIGKYEVTQEEFQSIMGYNPSFNKDIKKPVESVTYYDAMDYCNKLSIILGLVPYYTLTGLEKNGDSISSAIVSINGGNGIRLPNKNEWSYAASGGVLGTSHKYPGTDDSNNMWYFNNANGTTHNVGELNPNELGLYDMAGNVWEMTEGDLLNTDYMGISAWNPSVHFSYNLGWKIPYGRNLPMCGFRVCRK